ncbi:hypothetical protein A9Z42_0032610 [Trichoderma parareesei]|uniref:Uncharacterized protein n=1 Tax=Trichoderma parareesei TaxID=858221 RepID=A0A2H2ZL41_TRIPA|nr:hypothetical protein A9Z42_0032610 [Trichoderma parareesei]
MPKKPPPRFEISDLSISESDPRYAAAVRCVETYWKQATSITELETHIYLAYLRGGNILFNIPIVTRSDARNPELASVATHRLYPKRSAKGTLEKDSIHWIVYMLLSSVYERLPSEYWDIIEATFGHTTIEDHTDEYRRLYPAPNSQQKVITPAPDIALPAEASTVAPSTAQPTVLSPWSIDNVINTMSPSKRKRPGLEHESSAKRAKVEGSEMLKKINQQAEVMQKAIDLLQSTQDDKLREMRDAIEENRQAVTTMQSELRQFMSAAATTLRDMQERLDDLWQTGGLF